LIAARSSGLRALTDRLEAAGLDDGRWHDVAVHRTLLVQQRYTS